MSIEADTFGSGSDWRPLGRLGGHLERRDFLKVGVGWLGLMDPPAPWGVSLGWENPPSLFEKSLVERHSG